MEESRTRGPKALGRAKDWALWQVAEAMGQREMEWRPWLLDKKLARSFEANLTMPLTQRYSSSDVYMCISSS